MIIIRVECNKKPMGAANGDYHPHINRGCYSGNSIANEAIDCQADKEGLNISSNDRNHNTPGLDDILSYGGSLVCAFADWRQFKSWFPMIRGLKAVKDRARLALYHVPNKHVQRGRCQVVADSNYMHLVQVLPTDATLEQVERVYDSHFIGDNLCLTQSPSCMGMAHLPFSLY